MSDMALRANDSQVMARAYSEARLLLTRWDFGNVVFRQAKSVRGIVLLRIDVCACEFFGVRTALFQTLHVCL
jgi:hypothetical protein